MSTGRVIWLVWCLGWCAFWCFLAPFTLLLTLFPASASVALFWAPVGKPAAPAPGPWQPQLPAGSWRVQECPGIAGQWTCTEPHEPGVLYRHGGEG